MPRTKFGQQGNLTSTRNALFRTFHRFIISSMNSWRLPSSSDGGKKHKNMISLQSKSSVVLAKRKHIVGKFRRMITCMNVCVGAHSQAVGEMESTLAVVPSAWPWRGLRHQGVLDCMGPPSSHPCPSSQDPLPCASIDFWSRAWRGCSIDFGGGSPRREAYHRVHV